MIRRVSIIATTISLLLCAATVVLWVRSYYRAVTVTRVVTLKSLLVPGEHEGDEAGHATSAFGVVEVVWFRNPDVIHATAEQAPRAKWSVASESADDNWRSSLMSDLTRFDGGVRLGPYGFGYYTGAPLLPQYAVAVPYWLLAIPTLPMPAIWVWRFARRQHRASKNRCATCGYDLRVSTDRCPECGTPIPAKS